MESLKSDKDDEHSDNETEAPTFKSSNTEIEGKGNSINIPGSGIWEKSENKRWVVVDTSLHRIPRRNRMTSEGSLDPSLSITSFVTNFEVEEQQPSNYRVISDGSSLVRIDEDNNDEVEEEIEDEDPMEGSSGTQQTRRVTVRARRKSSNVSSPERILPPPEVAEPSHSRGRRKRRRGKRKKVLMLNGVLPEKKKKKSSREIILSVESSPGRDSPSPETLNRIVQRGLEDGLVGYSVVFKQELSKS